VVGGNQLADAVSEPNFRSKTAMTKRFHFRTLMRRFLCVWHRLPLIASVTLVLAFTANANAAFTGTGGMKLEGVNISGGEFTPDEIPGSHGINYAFPSTVEMDYSSSKGMTVIRVPFLWERLQQTANGPLDPKELWLLDRVVNYANSKGLSVILDPHNYGAYRKMTIGVLGGQPNSMFADFWSQVATHYGNNPQVIFGLMNEPVGSAMTSTTWAASAQSAIDAIRATGATNLILVPSTYWEHAENFVRLDAADMVKISDPANNFSYEVHQYLDYDGSGSHPDFPSASDSVATLSGLTQWLVANNRTAFLGEIGVTSDPGALADLDAMLKYMHANATAWTGFTYWTAGAWYPANYMFSVEPHNGVDTAQMLTLMANLGNKAPTLMPAPIPTPTPTPAPAPSQLCTYIPPVFSVGCLLIDRFGIVDPILAVSILTDTFWFRQNMPAKAARYFAALTDTTQVKG
jgi:endoglucanase